MYRIDEMITEIHDSEAVTLPGELTDEQQNRICNTVLGRIHSAEDVKRRIGKTRRFPTRKRYIVLLAATLILALGLTVFAAKEKELDITLMNFMGLNDANVLQLEGGEVIISEKTTSMWLDYAKNPKGEEKEISITRITSIGDRNSAYLRVNTDYNLPDGFDETTDYILPENSKIDITYRNIWGYDEFRTYGSSFTAFYEEGKLGFLISIENCENLNKCKVELKIENLYWYHDLGKYDEDDESEPEELLCEGVWETGWTYSYKSNIRTYRMFKSIDSSDGEIFLTKVEVSPISIRIEAVRNSKDREKEWNGDIIEGICYNNGECIQIERSSSGGIGNGIFLEEFVKVGELGAVLDPERVSYLIICGEKVDL